MLLCGKVSRHSICGIAALGPRQVADCCGLGKWQTLVEYTTFTSLLHETGDGHTVASCEP